MGEGLRRLLEHIGWQGSDVIEMILPTVKGVEHGVHVYNGFVPKLLDIIDRQYCERCEQAGLVPMEKVRMVSDTLLWEMILNAAEHAHKWNPQKSIRVTVWLGDAGVMIGCRDEGNFFKRREVKRRFEAGERMRRYDKPGRGYGTTFIRKNADEVYVDRTTGTINVALYFFE